MRDICGGGKGTTKSAYDPQIAAAANQTAATAARAQEFAEHFYDNVVTPLLQQQSESSQQNQSRLNTLYDLNAQQMRESADRYHQYGVPAEENYYKMVQQYSEPEEMERQAELARGDFSTAAAAQKQQMMRQYSSLGIDPTSGAAVSAMTNASVMNAANQAAAMNRARNSARQLGMQLTSDAANFGRGGQSGILQFGAGAQGNATSGFGIANAALNTGMNAGNSVMQGYDTASRAYGNIMSTYGGLGQAQMQANAQSQGAGLAGLGQLGGMVLSQGLPAGFLSDIRAKENIQHVSTLPSGIKVYSFTYKEPFRDKWGYGAQIGVIAQEVAEIIPDAVTEGHDGYLRVNYTKVR